VGNVGVRGANAGGAGGTGYRWRAAEHRQCQVDGAAGPQPGDNAGDSHRGLVMHGGPWVFLGAPLWVMHPNPESSDIMGSVVSGMRLPPPAIDWRRVEGDAELMCL
jgi:hypothetical protein